MKWIAILLSLIMTASAQVNVINQWNGDQGRGGSTTTKPVYKDHPDLAVVAANGYVLQVTGQDVNLYGTDKHLISSTPFLNFLQAAGTKCLAVTDPRAAYLGAINRFAVVDSCPTGDWLVVSSSNDLANASWKGVNLGGHSGDLTMHIASNTHGIMITEYNSTVTCCSYRAYTIPIGDAAWVGSGNTNLSNLHVFNTVSFEDLPCENSSYMVAITNPLAAGPLSFSLLVTPVLWNGSTSSLGTTKNIPSKFQTNPTRDESQPGGSILLRGAESKRIFTCQQIGNSLMIVRGAGPCKSNCGLQVPGSHMGFQWWEVNTTTMTIRQQGSVFSSSMAHLFPAGAVDSSGNLLIVTSCVSSNQFASVCYFFRNSTDALGSLKGPVILTAGKNMYGVCAGHNPVGWGTYAQAGADGEDPSTLVLTEGYANSTVPCSWGTRIGIVKVQ